MFSDCLTCIESRVSVIFCSVDVLLVPPSVSVGVSHLFLHLITQYSSSSHMIRGILEHKHSFSFNTDC